MAGEQRVPLRGEGGTPSPGPLGMVLPHTGLLMMGLPLTPLTLWLTCTSAGPTDVGLVCVDHTLEIVPGDQIGPDLVRLW